MIISYLGKSFILVISFFFLINECKSQVLKGIVYDRTTKQPVTNALIKVGNKISLSNNEGYFTINSFSNMDTLKIKALGYERFVKALQNLSLKDTIKLFLVQDGFELNEVSVKAKRDYLRDSLSFRNDYSSIFNYKHQPLKDFVVHRDFFSEVPTFKGQSANNIAVFNLLSLLNLVNSKNEPVSKLQQTLLKEEDQDYIDRRFTKQIIQQQTGLTSDSLFIFINKYKPDAIKLKGMNDYQLGTYIKEAFKEYLEK
nr:hypothetical protein [Pseudopedobacter sp.]